jgi:HPt (histidine-containing phosphotransfer) domain-containing protein
MRARVGIESPAKACPARRDRPPTPIDRGHLRRFTRGNLALEREVLQLVHVQLPLSLERLGAAASDREWRHAAHTIKGSAAAIGAWRLARAAERAEKLDFSGAEAPRERALLRVHAAVSEVLRHIERVGVS